MELTNALNWFEIPAADFDRAKKFYETIYDYQMPESMVGPIRMGFFLYDFKGSKIGGALCAGETYIPSQQGTLVYLTCTPDLQPVLDKVEQAGGKIIMAKKQVSGDNGYMAIILDSEGNRVALHSRA
jgi:predicted enzyme related to lactoylglutathione lyase